MQTLSEFLSQWRPAIMQQANSVSDKIEEGRDMSRVLSLEQQLSSAIDEAVQSYSESGSFAACNLPSFEVGYLFHLRLLEASYFAQFLDDCGFGEIQMSAPDWIEFFGIRAWHHFLVHKWRHDFARVYPPKT
jgi:hypothetical protein